MDKPKLIRDSFGCYRNAAGRILMRENCAIECLLIDSIFLDRLEMAFDDFQAMTQVESHSIEEWR